MSKRGSTISSADLSSKRRKDEKPTGWEDSFALDIAPMWEAAYAEDPEAKRAAQLRWLTSLMSERSSSFSQATLDCLLQSFLPYDPERLCNPMALAKKLAPPLPLTVHTTSANSGSRRLYFNGTVLPLKPDSGIFRIGRSYDDHAGLTLNLRGLVDGVSRVHAELFCVNSVWSLRALYSAASCGMSLNGEPMAAEKSAVLSPGSTIRIGSVVLWFF
jgi:hypothetical protein